MDTSSGSLTDADINFQGGLGFPFDDVFASFQSGNGWIVEAADDEMQQMQLEFTTTPNAGSLVGLIGGTIISGVVVYFGDPTPVFGGFSGSIIPAISVPTPNVPKPVSLALLALGFLAWLPFGFARRRALRA